MRFAANLGINLEKAAVKISSFFTWGDNSVDLLKSQESSAILSPGMSNRIPSRERSGEGHTYPLRNGFKERMIRANSGSKKRMYFLKRESILCSIFSIQQMVRKA